MAEPHQTPTSSANDLDSTHGPVRDDVAYMAPMFTFLICVWAGGRWPEFYPLFYILRALAVAVQLIVFWRSYTSIRWNGWRLGALMGVVGIAQWVGMQLLLQKMVFHFHDQFGAGQTYRPFAPSADPFNPYLHFTSPAAMWLWIAVRVASASIVVPIMEELFWRDFLWRSIIAPANFKLARVGEKSWPAFLIVAIAFATVHGNWWLTAIVWGMLIGGLLIRTTSLGACIVMHGVTNLLLAGYVLYTQDWSFW